MLHKPPAGLPGRASARLPSLLLFSGSAIAIAIAIAADSPGHAMGRLRGGLSLASRLLLLLLGCVMIETSTQEMLCGVPALGRIKGGFDAQNGQWPWQVNLNFNGQHVCGATLIAPQWLVTAAHCFPKVNPIDRYEATLGAFQLKNPSPDIQVKLVQEVIKHPDFDEDEGSQGDIALVKLKGAISYTRTVRPICLPASSVTFPSGMNCTVTGWGNVLASTTLPVPMTLQQLQVPIIGLETCKCLYRKNPDPEEPHILHSDMMCAGFAEGKKDACQGDSGGPLSCRIGTAWLLAGVVSWGDSCGAVNRPGVYIRTSVYANWIKEKVPEVKLNEATADIEPVSEVGLCSNTTRQDGPYDDIQAPPGWSQPLDPNSGSSNNSSATACVASLPLLFLLLQSCLW